MAKTGIQTTDALMRYLLDHSIPQSDVHRRLVAVTEQTLGDTAVMQISEEQGPLLTFLTRLIGARTAVEVGTFTGLSALCIAEGLGAGGRLTCFDISDEWTSIGVPFWEEAGVADRITRVIGPAAETLSDHPSDPPVDFAFIDADKAGYLTYVDLILERMRPGGLIVADNALYGGAVLDPEAEGNAAEIRRFNEHVAADARVDCTLVNVGDGLMLIRKR
jgi:caffeoyl-CoA O-methyltransferase